MTKYRIEISGIATEFATGRYAAFFIEQGTPLAMTPVESYIERHGVKSYRTTVTMKAEELTNNDPRCIVTILEA